MVLVQLIRHGIFEILFRIACANGFQLNHILRNSSHMWVINAPESLDGTMLQTFTLESVQITIRSWYFHQFLDRQSHILNETISQLNDTWFLHIYKTKLRCNPPDLLGESTFIHKIIRILE